MAEVSYKETRNLNPNLSPNAIYWLSYPNHSALILA